jgi:DNA repair protein RadA/Sms
MAVFGEVSLSGAIRPVSHANHRLKEAAKLGFARAAAPAAKAEDEKERAIDVRPMERIADLVALIAAGKPVRTVERQRADG